MILRIKVLILLLFAICVFSTIICTHEVFASNAITEVSVSPDLRRVAIKSDGQIAGHTATVTAHPSRLVIDIPAAVVGPEPRIVGLEKDSALLVRISKTGSGAQVALDFGSTPVPDHRVRQIDNYLIVSSWRMATPAASPGSRGAGKSACQTSYFCEPPKRPTYCKYCRF